MARVRGEVSTELNKFLTEQGQYLNSIGIELDPVTNAIKSFLLDGGKRFRPLFAYVGYLAAGGPEDKSVLKAVSSLELLHACALIHDDVMDASDTRRGAPSIHKSFEKMHVDNHLVGSSAQFGVASAILIGDLALIWSAQMLHNSGISSQDLIRALPIYDEMRVELMAGQYLDVYEQSLGTQSIERSLKVARFKSGKYTIERPLHFGATLGGASNELIGAYTKYGIPLGEAFQLRDDVLGVFGDPAETGKPAGDDLREGKRTVLMAVAIDKADATQEKVLKNGLGNPDLNASQVEKMQEIITQTGALAHIELMIEELTNTSLSALNFDEINPVGKDLLTQLAVIATSRKI